MSGTSQRRIHPLAILGAVLFALLVVGLTYWAFMRAAARASNLAEETVYNMTVMPAPTQTPTVFTPTQLPTPTAKAPDILPEGAIGIGSFVKVVGTSGLGLNIRAAAGRGQNVNFLANDAEMFEVIGGPEVVDDHIWWQLEAPLDSSRTGWAAEEYLERIKKDNTTP